MVNHSLSILIRIIACLLGSKITVFAQLHDGRFATSLRLREFIFLDLLSRLSNSECMLASGLSIFI